MLIHAIIIVMIIVSVINMIESISKSLIGIPSFLVCSEEQIVMIGGLCTFHLE